MSQNTLSARPREAALKEEAWGSFERPPPRPNGAPLAALRFENVPEWDEAPAPPREWLIPDRIPHRAVTLLSGEGATGKSILALDLTVAVVIGRGWLNFMPEMSGGAIYVSAEDEADEVRRRLKPILARFDVNYSRLDERGFALLCLSGEDAMLAAPDRSGVLMPTPLFERLRLEARRRRPRLIVLDTLADAFGGSEIDRAQVRRFMGLLRGLALEADSAVLVVAHPSLEGIKSGSGLSGSTAWHNSPRARLYLAHVTTTDGEPDKELRELRFLKSNYGPLGEPLRLRWRSGFFVTVNSGGGHIEKAASDQRVEDRFLSLLTRFNSEGRYVGPSPGSNYAPARFAEEEEAEGTTRRAFEQAMKRFLKQRKIHIATHGSPSRQRRHLMLGPPPNVDPDTEQ